jgi:hypothetical protein
MATDSRVLPIGLMVPPSTDPLGLSPAEMRSLAYHVTEIVLQRSFYRDGKGAKQALRSAPES